MWLKSFFGSFVILFIIGILVFFSPDLQKLFGPGKSVDENNVSKLIDSLMNAPEIHLNYEDSYSKTQKNCLYHTCFDVYKCGGLHKKILVHISKPKRIFEGSPQPKEVSIFTKDYVDILEAITESGFYTEDPEEACIFVPPFNLLNEAILDPISSSKALEKMPNWNQGVNNLLFSFVTGNSDALKLEHGSAMVAAAGLSTFSYRNKFDLALPSYTILQRQPILTRKRDINLLVVQGNEVHDKLKPLIENLKHKPGVQVFYQHSDSDSFKVDAHGKQVKTLDILSRAKFCLVAREKYGKLSTPLLMATLHAGCIPIIVIDNLVLPFSEVLDWKRFSIRFYEHDSELIYDHVTSKVSQQRTNEMQNQIEFVYQAYFKDLPTITKTALQIVNERVFSQHAKTYRDWNLQNDIQSPLFMKNIPPAEDGFTAVILTYDRLSSLFQVIKSVAETPSLAKILVVWNNQNVDPPPMSEFPAVSKPIKVIRTKANLLTNRFYPYSEITTEAVLSMDDDIVMLTSDELEFAYQVWREFSDRLVGFPSRTHVWNNQTKQWKYESEWTNDVSMVLTGAAFYHKYWHYMFTYNPSQEGKEIKNWLDQRMNCEDIAMNFLIANATGKSPIKVTPRKKFKCSTPECNNAAMLSNYQSHLTERSDCVNFLVKKYGYMPLQKAEFRADPVLFKDKFPEKLKNFVNIGSL